MALNLPGQRGSRRWNAWTFLMSLAGLVVAFSFIRVSDATLQDRDVQIAGVVEFRVLPIGDSYLTCSIAWGAQSSDDNGYRKTLFKKLASRGNRIDFVGAVKSGDMSDPQHEGHLGYVFDDIA
ncbi:hypothetical protein BDV12DRAFT_201428 [Aspergillus spectabilis]